MTRDTRTDRGVGVEKESSFPFDCLDAARRTKPFNPVPFLERNESSAEY